MHGGTPLEQHNETLVLGCDVVFSTPGRLIHILAILSYNQAPLLSLSALTHLIIDEADVFLSDNWKPQFGHLKSFMSRDPWVWWISSYFTKSHFEIVQGVCPARSHSARFPAR